MVQSMNIDNPELILATSGESSIGHVDSLGQKWVMMLLDCIRSVVFLMTWRMVTFDGPEHLVEIQAN